MCPVELNDLIGLSKPLDTLILEISKGIGNIFTPMKIVQDAKATKKAKLIDAESQMETLELLARAEGNKKIVEWQIKERIKVMEEKRQININNVVKAAIDQLPDSVEETKPIDEDWITRFFSITQDISNEELQLIWGKILAGEFVHPNTYSLRTLETIKSISPTEAELFSTIGNFALVFDNDAFIYNAPNFSDEFKIPFSAFVLLQDIGILT